MKHYKTEKRTYTSNTHTHTTCDKCGEDIDADREMFDIFEGEGVFEFKLGEVYPEGGYYDKFSLDLCKTCSKDALKILKEHGFNIIHKECHA